MAAKTDPRLVEFRSKYLMRLVDGFRPSLVIVFGSRARGEGLAHSDLDLLIVSEAFRTVRWLDRHVRVHETLKLPFGVDLLCYTPEEYQHKREELGIVRTATEEGIIIFSSGESARSGTQQRNRHVRRS